MMKGFEVVDFLAQLIICLLFSTTIFTWPIISEGCFQIMVTNIVLDQIDNLGSCWTKPKRAHCSDANTCSAPLSIVIGLPTLFKFPA